MSLFESLRQNPEQLLIGGHQGHASPQWRPNTIENFDRLKGCGLSHIEVDLQLTKDREIVVYHDIDLGQKSPLAGSVANYTVSQLKDAFEINTLDEVLYWCEKNNLPAALEIKCHLLSMAATMPILAVRLAELLNHHRFGEFGFVFGTDYATLHQVKQLAPETALGLIVPFVPVNPLALMEELEASVYLCYIDNLSTQLVEGLHRGGYYVDGSVINTEDRLRQALALGVDIIESDYPLEMIETYRSIASL